MKRGYLSEYFEGVAAKRLSAVEADATRSNQHEYNAAAPMLELLGRPADKQEMDTRYVYLCDEEDAPIFEDSWLTLYDARKNHATRSEYRMYFPDTRVSQRAGEGDLLVVAKGRDGKLLVIIAAGASSIASQVVWLFGISEPGNGFEVRTELDDERHRVGFVAAQILENIGVVIEVQESGRLVDELIELYSGHFPKSAEFSLFARRSLPEVDPRDDPDATLMAWMEREEFLFRQLEHRLIGERIAAGFDTVDKFIAFSLSVQNRRKSRVGLALENHVEAVMVARGIRFKRSATTENRAKPDFLFPGQDEYHDDGFPRSALTMLATKSTCKDRWRQVLAEADRIYLKHLLTFEPSISITQTSEMMSKGLQLVVPKQLHATYAPVQRDWLFSLSDFLELVKERQETSKACTKGTPQLF